MSLFHGVMYNLKGLMLAVKTPRLLLLGILRFFVVLLLAIVLSGVVLFYHNDIMNLIWQMPEQGAWFYLWKILSWILSLILVAVASVLAYLVSQVLFCVFIMDYMSRITESVITGKRADINPESWPAFIVHLIKQEIPRAVIPLLISLFIMAIGLLTPAGPVIMIISSIVAATFLAWDNTDLIPARQMKSFNTRIHFLKKHLLFHIGFGLWFLIPWLNIVFLSFAPVGATLYYIELQQKKEM